MTEITTTFLRAHERMAQAPTLPQGYLARTTMVAGQWLVEANHPYLPSFVLVGDGWLAVQPNKPRLGGAISAYVRLEYFKQTGEILE